MGFTEEDLKWLTDNKAEHRLPSINCKDEYYDIKLSEDFSLQFMYDEDFCEDDGVNYICSIRFFKNTFNNMTYSIVGVSLEDLYKRVLIYLSERVETYDYKKFIRLLLDLPIPQRPRIGNYNNSEEEEEENV